MGTERLCRKPTITEALTILILDALIISYGVLSIKTESGWTFGLGLSAHIPLFLAATVSAISGMVFLKTPWRKLEDGMISAITVAMQAIIILLAIGGLVGSWIQSGVVPTLIFYGLNMLSPRFFLLASLLICSVVSLSTGSSWSTSGTVGIALMGIGAGLGIPAPVTAGFILSGAYFGDKISPLSDTTNLAPAVSGAELFDHIKAMLWTTLPTLCIVMGIAWFMGTKYGAGALDASKISLIQQMMASEFPISLMGFVPPLLVLTLAAMKIPAIPGIVSGMLLGSILALVHGLDIGSVLGALHSGYSTSLITKVSEAGDLTALAEAVKGSAMQLSGTVDVEMYKSVGGLLKDLLNRGGMTSMLGTISLILMALMLGGVMETCGYLEVILERLMQKVRTVGGLITSVIASCIFANMFLGDQYLAIVIPGRMFKPGFEKFEAGGRKLAPRMLSRSLEDSGTLTSVLVPWNTCGAYNSGVLGVPTLEYLPYAFLNWLNPLVAVAMTYMGIGVYWKDPESEPKK